MKFATFAVAALAMLAVGLGGCASKRAEGVKSDMHSQWTMVSAGTKAATDAASDALKAEGLKNVMAESTTVDGKAEGMKADGTKVKVMVKKMDNGMSEVSVTVGMMGDSSLGAEIAKKIKDHFDMNR